MRLTFSNFKRCRGSRGSLGRSATAREKPVMPKINDDSGLTLLELLISTAILSIIIIGLSQVTGAVLNAYKIKSDDYLLARARFAMERMAMFVQETGNIKTAKDNELKVTERVLDAYDNATHAYAPGGGTAFRMPTTTGTALWMKETVTMKKTCVSGWRVNRCWKGCPITAPRSRTIFWPKENCAAT